jgi:hypothetical protein
MTTFATPLNNVATTLGSAHTAGAGTLAVAAGDGALFGSPTSSAPVRFTVVKQSAFGASGQIVDRSALTIYKATGRTGDALTGLTAIEGTTDQSFAVGDVVAVWVTAGAIGDLNAAVNTAETSLAAHIADTANPHNVTAVQVGSATAQWNASKLQNRLIDSAVTPTDGMVLTWVASTARWTPMAAASGGGSLTVGTTPISGGGTGRLLYDAAGVVGETTSITTDGTTIAVIDSLLFPCFTAANNPGSGVGFYGVPGGGNLLFFCDGVLAGVVTHVSRSYRIPSDYAYSWDASTANTSGPDTTLIRRAAGVVGVHYSLDIILAPASSVPALRIIAANGTTVLATIGPSGEITPGTMSDTEAGSVAGNFVFLGSDHPDASGDPKLCRKGATSGTITVLG